jgi:glycosyltransferase involved in cell wall biosynthesis
MSLRVLLVNQPTDGGVAFHVETLARRLHEHGVAATVACPPGRWSERLAVAGIAVIAVPMEREISPRTDMAGLRSLRAALRQGDFDLVHTHSAKAGVLGRLAARSRHVPAVHTPHAWSFLAAGQPRNARLYQTVERTLARSTAAIICVSEGERRRGLQVADSHRLVVVMNGIALPESPVRSPTHPGIVVGTVARLAPQKGIAHLLEAYAAVRTVRDDVRLVIAGDGPLRAELDHNAEKLGIAETVTFTGAIPSPWPFLAELDVFVLPSLWEGLPYVLLEAMAAGLPCVATAVDGVAEAIPDRRFGTVVAPGDGTWLAREILALADDAQARSEMGRRAQAHVRDTFSIDAMVRATVDVYHRVLSPSDHPAGQPPALTTAGRQ